MQRKWRQAVFSGA